MSKLTPVGEVKIVANPQKELVKLSNQIDSNFRADKFAGLIKQCLTLVSDESKIKLWLVFSDGRKYLLDEQEKGLGKLRSLINKITAPHAGKHKFIFKSDKIEATYTFEAGKFSGKLDKLMKDAISYGVRMNEAEKISEKGCNILASDEFLGINEIFQKYKENFAPNASLSNLLPLFIAIDALNKKQFAKVYAELSKLLNDEMSFNPSIEADDTNQIEFSDED